MLCHRAHARGLYPLCASDALGSRRNGKRAMRETLFQRMRRRDVLAAVGGVATWSSPPRAQQRPIPTIGYLDVGSIAANRRENMAAFLKGLADTGYVEGRNVAFEYREAKGDVSLLPELARALVRRQV